MNTTESLSHLIERMHRDGVSYDSIKTNLSADGFSKHAIARAYVLATYPKGFKRFGVLTLLRLKAALAPLAIIGIVLASVASILATAEEPPKVYPLYVSRSGATAQTELSYGSNPAFANTEYFASVKNDFIVQHASFVSANLDTMEIEVFHDGVSTLRVPIATKGRPGSWWETPAGIYKIETKEEKHRSGISGVFQPWSMRFQGNFYVHGWPYHPDGTPVSTAYSGGCIRLQDGDAEALYNEVAIGMPLIVFTNEQPVEKHSFTRTQPNVRAESFLALDAASGFVFSEKNSDQVTMPGALAKLLTALVASEYINLDAAILVPEKALVDTPYPRLSVKQKVRVYDLLFPLLLEQSNEAAATLASVLGPEKFTAMMNKKAVSLGMPSTHVVEPVGISPENTTTAHDLFQLARYIANNRSFLFNVSAGIVQTSAYGPTIFKDIAQPFYAEDASFKGGVIDTEDAQNQNALVQFTETIGGESRSVFIILLGSADVTRDIELIRAHLHESYE